ncbi:AraC family transcriptional regulator [Algirhabdus cladophorae]|uniref:helix-turn-helix transcriptional regulator n=1 Tax=Algirhabdus cladophorae TaxID=3377108 RepID=UPI003B846006
MISELTLSLTDHLGPDEAFHFARQSLNNTRPKALHQQDYFEMFWVQHGRAALHLADKRVFLSEGDIVFLRPGDVHGFQGKGDETYVCAVLMLPQTLRSLAARHRGLSNQLFWSEASDPVIATRSISQLIDLSKAALKLEAAPRTPMQLEAFLLPLLADLNSQPDQMLKDAPTWLIEGIAAAQDPEVFRKGAAGLVEACGRAHAHVSRMMKKHTGMSPSSHINKIRMAYAARLLTASSDGLDSIAQNCGIANLSHFHRLFRDHYNMTPKAYRNRYQRNPITPV